MDRQHRRCAASARSIAYPRTPHIKTMAAVRATAVRNSSEARFEGNVGSLMRATRATLVGSSQVCASRGSRKSRKAESRGEKVVPPSAENPSVKCLQQLLQVSIECGPWIFLARRSVRALSPGSGRDSNFLFTEMCGESDAKRAQPSTKQGVWSTPQVALSLRSPPATRLLSLF